MKHSTPETSIWLLSGVVVTTVQDGGESAVTLTVSTPSAVSDPRTALATLATALQAAARERRAVAA
jgi:hypothetical protein